MEAGKDDMAAQEKPLDGLEEATAGWDPYVSDLLQGKQSVQREERRRQPRDNTPARRRAILASREKESSSST